MGGVGDGGGTEEQMGVRNEGGQGRKEGNTAFICGDVLEVCTGSEPASSRAVNSGGG